MKIVILHGAGGEHGITALGTAHGRWLLTNMPASAAQQPGATAPAAGHPGLHDADVRAAVLTDAQIERTGGLLALCAGAPIDLDATPAVFEELTRAPAAAPGIARHGDRTVSRP